MCTYRILHHSNQGYVVKCAACNSLKVSFGTIAVTLSEEEFYDFRACVEENYRAHFDVVCPDQRSIHIPTSDPLIYMVYSLYDLEQLIRILDEAHLSLEIERIFN